MKQPAGRRCDTVHSGVAEIGEQTKPGAVAQPPLHVDAAVAEHGKHGATIDTGQARHDFAAAENPEGAIGRQPGLMWSPGPAAPVEYRARKGDGKSCVWGKGG